MISSKGVLSRKLFSAPPILGLRWWQTETKSWRQKRMVERKSRESKKEKYELKIKREAAGEILCIQIRDNWILVIAKNVIICATLVL